MGLKVNKIPYPVTNFVLFPYCPQPQVNQAFSS